MTIKRNVESSAIHKIEYYNKEKVMVLSFNSDPSKEYLYFGVPRSKVIGFLRAESKGKYYHKHLKAYSYYYTRRV